MPQNAPPSVPSTPTPFRCTTTGTSFVPLEPLAQRLEVWLTLPSLSRWLTRTIRLGYAIQFARRPPKFNSVLETSVAVWNAPVLREEIAVLLAKDAIEPVPPAEMRQGFYSPYVIVPKKGGGLRPILDLRVLNQALHKLPFKMLMHRRMIVQAQGGRGAGPAGCAPLAHPDLVSRTHFPRDSTSLAHSSEEGPPFSGARHHMAPASRSMEPPCVAPGRDAADLSGLPPAVVETIIQARALSTRQAYALKWSLFATWCSSRREDPRRCTIGVVFSFLQERLERRL